MSNVEIAAIERDVANYKADIKLLEALERLEKNRDFITIIGKGYLEKEALRLVKLRTDPNTQSETSQRNIMRDIDGIASLNDYLSFIHRDGDLAKASLERSEQTVEAMLIEEQQGI